MSRFRGVFTTILSFLVLVLLGWGLFYLISLLLGAVRAAKPDSTVVSVLITVFAGFVSLLIKQTLDRRDAVRQQLREKKVAVYDDYMRLWFDTFHLSAKAESASPTTPQPPQLSQFGPELQVRFVELGRQLILWGSVGVIKKHVALRNQGRKLHPMDREKYLPLVQLEEALKAIRTDLGHSNFGLQSGELLRVFINETFTATAPDGTTVASSTDLVALKTLGQAYADKHQVTVTVKDDANVIIATIQPTPPATPNQAGSNAPSATAKQRTKR